MAVTTAPEALLDDAPAAAAPTRDPAVVAAVVAVSAPLVVLAARCALWRSHVFVRGDLALIDLAARKASHVQQTLGPYDRFGWHHPGPAYFYILAVVSRLVGPGLRAQAAGASLVNGLALAGAVLVVGRLAGRRAALGAGALLCAGTLAVGSEVMFNPWTPYVVILPLLLVGVLAVGATGGSGQCLAACYLVATFAVETDVGAAPVAALACLMGTGGWALARAASDRPPRTARARLAPALILLGTAAALWLPPVVEQLQGSPGNLALIVRFMTAPHRHAGLGAAAGAVGAAQLRLLGLHTGAAPWGLALPATVAAAALGVGALRGSALACRAGGLALVATAVSVLAAALVVGPVYGYLVEWSIAVPLVGAIGLVMAISTGPADAPATAGLGAILIPGLGMAIFGTGLLLRVMALPDLGSYSAADVGEAWSLLRPQVSSAATVQVDSEDPAGWAVAAGLADELDAAGIRYEVPGQWAFQYGTDRVGARADAVVTLRAPSATGAGRLLGVAGPVSVWFDAGSPSGRQPGR